MKVVATDTFFKSLERLINAENPLKWVFWERRYYNFKNSLQALRKYFKITTKMVPWDYSSVLKMMVFQISTLAEYMEKYGYEVEESRMEKVKRMKEFVKLAKNQLEDNFANRCGYKDNESEFIPVEGKEDFFSIEYKDKEIEKHNSEVFKEAHKLEEKEWDEMFEILKEMRGWWD